MYNYTLDPCGLVYITIGDGGNRERMAITHADEPGNCPEVPKRKSNCAFNFTLGPATRNFFLDW